MKIILKNPVKDDSGWHQVGEVIDLSENDASRLCQLDAAKLVAIPEQKIIVHPAPVSIAEVGVPAPKITQELAVKTSTLTNKAKATNKKK